LHSKCYIWDSDTYYVGSQTFGHPFADEVGLLITNVDATRSATKYYEFIKFCMILQKGGYTDTIDAVYTGMFPVPPELSFDHTMGNPLMGTFVDTNPLHGYGGSKFDGTLILGLSPRIQAMAQAATPELKIFYDIFNTAKKTLDISILALGAYPAYIPFTLKWQYFDDLFINAVNRGVRIRLIFSVDGFWDQKDGLIKLNQDKYFAFTHFQKMKLQLNANCKNGGGIDIRFMRGGHTPQRFDEEGELYCSCPGFNYCQTPKQLPNDPKPGTNGRSGVCNPQMPAGQDTNSMMYHKKMIISDNAVYISSSNFTLDYFLITGDFSAYIKPKDPTIFPMRDALSNMYQKDWERAEAIEPFSCKYAQKYASRYNDPKNEALTSLVYVDPKEICGKTVKCDTDFNKNTCVSGYDKQTNMCLASKSKTKSDSGNFCWYIIIPIALVILLIIYLFRNKDIGNM
jgi:hypothetical protein